MYNRREKSLLSLITKENLKHWFYRRYFPFILFTFLWYLDLVVTAIGIYGYGLWRYEEVQLARLLLKSPMGVILFIIGKGLVLLFLAVFLTVCYFSNDMKTYKQFEGGIYAVCILWSLFQVIRWVIIILQVM